MSYNLRHKEIIALLNENGAVSIRELTKKLFVSEATVRRDLAELEKSGALKRVFGGAKPVFDTSDAVPLYIRESLDSNAKKDICSRAAELIKDGDTVFIDGSSTAQHLIGYIKKDVVVVTNSIKTAQLACNNHIKTYCAGGLLLENSFVCIGHKAVDFAKDINTNICFVSCKGVSLDGVFSDTSEEDSAIRKAFMKNSATRVMLITGNKFGSSYMHTLCRAEEVDYVFSDTAVPESISSQLRKSK